MMISDEKSFKNKGIFFLAFHVSKHQSHGQIQQEGAWWGGRRTGAKCDLATVVNNRGAKTMGQVHRMEYRKDAAAFQDIYRKKTGG